MRRLIAYTFAVVICGLFVTSDTLAQTTRNQSSEQSLQELVGEVRELRAQLQKMNAAVYKGQLVIERFKLQQETVTRLSRELTEVGEQLSETRAREQQMATALNRVSADVGAGIKHPADQTAATGELHATAQRANRLAKRESHLKGEMTRERAKLEDLNAKLNALEVELSK